MGHLMSCVEKVDAVYFDKIPTGKIIKVKNAFKVDGMLVVQCENGRFLTDHRGLTGSNAYLPWGQGWEPALLKCLVKLGVISKQDMDRHLHVYTERRKEQERKDAMKSFILKADKLGIKLTEAQKKKLK